MAAEQSFYSDEKGVRITATRAIFGSTTYSMANISSVRTAEDPPKRARGIWTAIIGICLLIIGITTGLTWLTITGVVILLIGIVWAWMATGTFHLKITSASGETTAVSSKDKEYITKITQAFNEAIINRG